MKLIIGSVKVDGMMTLKKMNRRVAHYFTNFNICTRMPEQILMASIQNHDTIITLIPNL